MVKIAVPGLPGSYSEQAALKYDLGAELMYCTDVAGVLHGLRDCDLGLIPIKNTICGELYKTSLKAIATIDVNVNHCLLARPGAKIRKIASQAPALQQCARYIRAHYPDAEIIETSDTALAARDLDMETAAIASKRAAKVYGLEILAEDIQDVKPNITTFKVVKEGIY